MKINDRRGQQIEKEMMMNNNIIVQIDDAFRDTCPAGTFNAVCSMVHNLGRHKGYNEEPPVNKIALVFEVEATKSSDEPKHTYVLSKIVNATLNEKSSLRQILTACRGRDLTPDEHMIGYVDLKTLIGKPCTVTVTSTANGERIRALISHVANHMAGMQMLTPTLDQEIVPEWVTRFQAAAIPVDGTTVAK